MMFRSLPLLICICMPISVSAKRLVKRDGLVFEYSITFRNICYSDDNDRLRFILRIPINTCMVECALHEGCEIAQYQVRYHLCELFKAFDESEAVEKSGCVIVRKSDMDIQQLSCAEECQNGKTCDIESKQCVYKECKDTSSSENGNILGNRKEVESKVRLQCGNDEEETGQKTAVCQIHGSWSDFPERCATPFHCPVSDTVYTTMLFSDGTEFTYRFVLDELIGQTEALAYCVAEGGHLMTTFPVNKRQVLLQLIHECGPTYQRRYWIDGNNRDATDFKNLTEWVTSTGEQFTTDFWRPGKPNNPRIRRCAALRMWRTDTIDGNFVIDRLCDFLDSFVCEK